MRILILILCCSFFLTMCRVDQNVVTPKSETINLLVGTYTQKEGHVDGKASGVYKVQIDMDQTTAHIVDSITGLINPSYLAVDHIAKRAVIANEIGRNFPSGWLTLVDISEQGFGQKLDTISTRSYAPCHISQSANKSFSFTNYVGGVIGNVEIKGDTFGNAHYLKLDPSTKSNHVRQEDSHPHSSLYDNSGEFRYIADLGTDKIWIIKESEAGKVGYEPNYFLLPSGSGPRHMVFDKSQKFLYVINELSNTIATLRKDPNNGSLSMVGDLVESCPTEVSATNSSADIHISKDDRYLYTSNRGHNSIGVYTLSPTPKLLNFLSTEGQTPRNFLISNDGKYVLVANQDSGDIAVFNIKKSGLLEFKFKFDIPTPVCLVEL